MTYENIPPIDQDELVRSVQIDNPKYIGYALIRSSLYIPDNPLSLSFSIDALSSSSSFLRESAAISIGNIARISGTTSKKAIAALQELVNDPEMGGTAQDSIEDINKYVYFK